MEAKGKFRMRNLIEEALEAQERAHTPYSGFRVGVSLLTKDGEIYSSCNVEAKPSANTLHAEMRAMADAVEDGHDRFSTMVVVTDSSKVYPPCGNCRNFLATFQEDLEILVVDKNEDVHRFNLEELLPHAYTGRSMEDAPTQD